MKEPISIKEILAVVIKRGFAILCAAVVFAALLGGLQGVKKLAGVRSPENTPEKVAERNEETMKAYQIQHDMLEAAIEKAQYKQDKQKEYNTESLFMQLDPYDKYRSYVLLAVTEVDENAFQQVYDQEGTPVDYVVSKILNQYEAYWNNLDIMGELANNPYPDSKEKYIREIAKVAETDGGILAISVNAQTAAEASMLCDSIYESILLVQPTIAQATYAHALTVVDSGTKNEIDYEMAKNQIINLENVDTYQMEIEENKYEMKNLKKPSEESVLTMSTVVKSAVKWAIIGGVVGFVMACAFVWLMYILSDGVETSRQAEAILGVPYYGSAAKKGNLFVRLADRFVGERCWKDQEQAVCYIAENAKARMDGLQKIALLSTLAVCEEDAGVAMVLKALRDQGHTVTFAAKAEENPAAIAALRESDCVILAERLGKSNRNAMLQVCAQAVQLDAKVAGFITL